MYNSLANTNEGFSWVDNQYDKFIKPVWDEVSFWIGVGFVLIIIVGIILDVLGKGWRNGEDT